jgi:hypothetical protein
MPSPSKHSYTKSATTSESYAGNRGKTALLHAIELLFYIKSAEFKKFHPSFITPSAEEFLDYIQSRHRKYIILPTLRHRPLYSAATAIPKPPVLFKQFIAFIHAPAAASSFQSIIGCLYIVVESLSLYGTIKSALSLSAPTDWRATFCSASFLDEFTAPVYWLLEHKMSSCFSYRSEILAKITQPLIKKSAAILDAISITSFSAGAGTGTGTGTGAGSATNPNSMLEVLGQQYVHAFQKVMSDELYKIQFVAPISFLFARGGVPSCKEFCESFIKKYTEFVALV